MTLAYAVCSVASMPLRSQPSHRAEQVSQILLGERMEVLQIQADGWAQVITEWDQYLGWVKEGQIQKILYKDYKKPLRSLSASTTDFIELPEGKFLLSPGSSLFQMKRKSFPWRSDYHFKGKKIVLADVVPGPKMIECVAKLFLGTPYVWGGRSIAGIDCSGFTQMVYKMMNVRIPRDAYQQAEVGETIGFLQEAMCGDLAFFDNEEGRITHVGILLDSHNIIHATETSGCVVIDAIDNGGIISRRLRMRTHNLRLVKRLL
jgi:hypothetical protein